VQVTVLQAHEPGAEAEADFGQSYAEVAGVLLKLWMFVMRLSCSGRRSPSRSPLRPRTRSRRAADTTDVSQ